jgi:subtilisin family serine protease
LNIIKLRKERKNILVILYIIFLLFPVNLTILMNRESASFSSSNPKIENLDPINTKLEEKSSKNSDFVSETTWNKSAKNFDLNGNSINDNFEITLRNIAEKGYIEKYIDTSSKTDEIFGVDKKETFKIYKENIPVIISFTNSDFDSYIKLFESMGGILKSKYDMAINGFAGHIGYENLMNYCDSLNSKDIQFLINEDNLYQAQLYYSGRDMNLRPYVWNTLSRQGDFYSSIAVIDTGIDESHEFFDPGYSDGDPSYKIVGWQDEVNSLSDPYDDNGHGTHCSGIAAGEGTPNYDSLGRTVATAAYNIDYTYYGIMAGEYIFNWTRFNVTDTGGIEIPVEFEDHTPGLDDVDFWAYLYHGETIVDLYEISLDSWSHNLSTTVSSGDLGQYSFRFVMNLVDNTGDGLCSNLNITFRSEVHWPFNPPLFGSGDPWTGVAPEAHLVGVKVLDNFGSGWSSDIINGIDWVIANKNTYNITTMSLSLGGSAGQVNMIDAVNNAVEEGIVTIVSAGNDGPGGNSIGSPGDADKVITVASMNINDQITDYSSEGGQSYTGGTSKPDITAPGGSFNNLQMFSADSNDNDAYGAYPSDIYNNDLEGAQGTSMACPAVAGASNLLIDAMGGHQSWGYTGTEAKRVKALLLMSATETYPLLRENSIAQYSPKLDRGGKDVHEGYGRLNIDIAIEAYTQELTLGSSQNYLISSSYENAFDKHGHGCYVNLINGESYTFALNVPGGADFDLYLYSNNPSSIGEPILVASSVNPNLGADEYISYVASSTGKYYLIAKAITGKGNANIYYPVLDHDLSVSLEVPDDPEINDTYIINATVENNGNFVENNLNLYLYLDSSLVNSTPISSLGIGGKETITYSWVPTEYKTYNFTVYSPTVAGETFSLNNEMSKLLQIREITLFDGLYINYTVSQQGLVADSRFSYSEVSNKIYHVNWDVFMGSTNNAQWDERVKNRTIFNSSEGFENGSHTPVWIFNDASLGDFIPIAVANVGDHLFNVSKELYYDLPGYGTIEVWELEDLDTPGGFALYEKSMGLLISGLFSAFDPLVGEFSYEFEFVETNAVFSYITFNHDVEVVVDVPSGGELGNSYRINATVINRGLSDESNVHLNLYLDGDLVDSIIAPNLFIGANATITFEWNPIRFGIYNFTAYAPAISGEDYISNNMATGLITFREIILYDGMHLNYLMTQYGAPEPSNITYTQITERIFQVDWHLQQGGQYYEAYWNVDAYTRIMSESGGNQTVLPYQHTPWWIYSDTSLGDIIPIAVGGLFDHDFNVTGESTYVFPGFGQIELWELQDLSFPLSKALYEKNSGILFNGTFYFYFLIGWISYTLQLIDTNAIYRNTDPPGSFTLTSNAGSPDTDGNFDLIWTSSSGADNYSVYMYPEFINDINGSLTMLANQNGITPFHITDLSSGTYNFIVVAYNETGYILSNCIEINVELPEPPGPFTLSSNADSPDTDGNFDLTWTGSLGVDNYSIYRYSGLITQINGSLVQVADQTATSPYPITGLTNGTYYYIIVAYNKDGETLSNCLLIEVAISPQPPGPFILSSNAGSPDTNGNFDLTWTGSLGANNFSIYRYSGFITEINGSLVQVADQTATSPYSITGLTNGAYYFIIVAYNQYGETLSNCISVNVSIRANPPAIPGYNLTYFLIAILGITFLLLRLKLKRNFKFKS